MPPAMRHAVKTPTAMNHHLPGDREFNTPEEMLVRVTFIGMLVALSAGVLLIVAGLLSSEPRLLVAGFVAMAMTCAARGWLQRGGVNRLEATPAAALSAKVDEEHGTHLLRLLEEWEALEGKRGSPDFDPWALQVVRNDIRKVVESDPALEQLFTELQRAA